MVIMRYGCQSFEECLFFFGPVSEHLQMSLHVFTLMSEIRRIRPQRVEKFVWVVQGKPNIREMYNESFDSDESNPLFGDGLIAMMPGDRMEDIIKSTLQCCAIEN